jgi:hypothetical protein
MIGKSTILLSLKAGTFIAFFQSHADVPRDRLAGSMEKKGESSL